MLLILSVLGLFLAAVASIIEKVAPKDAKRAKGMLVVLIILGLFVAAYNIFKQNNENHQQQDEIVKRDASIGTLIEVRVPPDLDSRLTKVEELLTQRLAKNPAAPPPLSSAPASKYFVQIAVDTSHERL